MEVIKAVPTDVIPTGAFSIVRVGYDCERCGRMHEKAYVLHKDEELNGPLREVPVGLEDMLGLSVDDGMTATDFSLDEANGALGESKVMSKLVERRIKRFQVYMEATKENVAKLIERLEQRIEKDDYFFVPKHKCEQCGHTQSWMGRRAGKMMLGYLIMLAMLGYQLYEMELVWDEMYTRQYVLLGLMVLFGGLFLIDAMKMVIGGKLVKSPPQITFDEIQLKIDKKLG